MSNRYNRQTRLKGFGPSGQARLGSAKVLVVGLGGLGLPVVQYLNAMGIGALGLVDQDVVELHNLQRQVLYSENDIGKLKIEVAIQKLEAQNSETVFHTYDTFLTRENALEIIQPYDIVVDATDNFPTRYLINDACVILGKPFVYGALHGFEGHVSVFNYENGPTYRCLYPNMPQPEEVPNCNDNGVLGVIPGVIGTLQALETVKVLSGIGQVMSGQLLVFDGLSQHTTKIKFNAVTTNQEISELKEFYEPLDCELVREMDAESFQNYRKSGIPCVLLDVRTEQEFQSGHLAEAINIPLNNLDLSELQDRMQREVFVICQSGKRSAKAVQQLQKSYPEFTFYSILGGMNKMMTLST